MSKTGNIKFCSNCHNIMDAIAQEDKLEWQCSIECTALDVEIKSENDEFREDQKQDEESTDDGLVILSETIDDGINVHLNPYNEFTVHDTTLLRCYKRCPNANDDKRHPGEMLGKDSEVIIFKQNIATSNSNFICTVCNEVFKEK